MHIRSVLVFLAVLFFIINYSLSAQTTSHYQSKATYDRNSKELIKRLKHHLSDEFTAEETSETIKKINLARLRYLTMLVEDKWFIEDQALETYVNDIVSRLVDANELEERQRTVLVMRTHSVNATNYGKGIFFVTLGMLATIKTEDELAFALAHEIAHDELTHIRHNILRRAEAEKKDQLSESLKRVLTEESEDDDKTIEILRQSISESSQFSKKAEFEADSLGTTFFTRAGYSPQEGESLFDILNNPTKLKNNIGIEFLLPLHSEAYPLQDEWFIRRFSESSKPTPMLFGLSLDSLESHPELELRRQKFKHYKYERPVVYLHDQIAFKKINREAELELIEMCDKKGQSALSLYFALQLLYDHPGNTHLISRITKILLDLRTWKESGIYHRRVDGETKTYSDELKLLNNMVQNMSKHEASELAYHFISNKTHFNVQEPSHYHLKWSLCLVTNRPDEANELKNQYKERFKSAIEAYTFK